MREFVYELTSSWPPARVLGGSRAAVRGQDPRRSGESGEEFWATGSAGIEFRGSAFDILFTIQTLDLAGRAPPRILPDRSLAIERASREPLGLTLLPRGCPEGAQGPCGHDNPSFGTFLEEVFWKNLGRDGRSGGILTTPRSGISMRICLDRSKASKQP